MSETQGGPAGTTLLIVHADDLGLSDSVNRASFAALDEGIVTSASVMVNCPWFAEVIEFAKTRPHLDLGVHVTMTSEWSTYRWRPILSRQVRSLTDGNGYLHSSVPEFAKSVCLAEMKLEIRAQIETAVRAGLRPTHVDSHMYANGFNSLIYRAFSEVASEFSLPHIAASYRHSDKPSRSRQEMIFRTWPLVLQALPPAKLDEWDVLYSRLLGSLRPGLNQLTVHLGFDEPELQYITRNQTEWNAAWRQRDMDILRSPRFQELLQTLGIKLTCWRKIFPNGSPGCAMGQLQRPEDVACVRQHQNRKTQHQNRKTHDDHPRLSRISDS